MTRRGSRQLVNHGHILVNGKKVDIPSYQLKPGDLLELKSVLHKNDKVLEALQNNDQELNADINEALIVEWYNRLIK